MPTSAPSTVAAVMAEITTGGRPLTGVPRRQRWLAPSVPATLADPTAPGTRKLRSPIHLAEDGIDRAHDRDDVGDARAGKDVRQHREIRERRAAPLHAIRLVAAVGDQVTADF